MTWFSNLYFQIDGIKDKARVISELPEDEYNKLVIQARDFSLTQSGVALAMFSSNTDCLKSSGTSVTSSVVGEYQCQRRGEDVNSDGCDGYEHKMASVSHMSDDDDDDDRSGCVFDYVEPNSPGERFNKVLSKYGEPHDEVYPVESDDDGHSLSHRTGGLLVSEMTTYKKTFVSTMQPSELSEYDKCETNNRVRQQNTATSDEAFACDSDSGDDHLVKVVVDPANDKTGPINIHRHLYSEGCAGSCNGVRECKSRSIYGGASGSVDKTVTFPFTQPPFDHPLDTNKLASSIERLMDGRKPNDNVPNLPAAEVIGCKSSLLGTVSSQEDNDRKKKKKKKDKKGK